MCEGCELGGAAPSLFNVTLQSEEGHLEACMGLPFSIYSGCGGGAVLSRTDAV